MGSAQGDPPSLLLQPSPYIVFVVRADPKGVISGKTLSCTVAVRFDHAASVRPISVDRLESTAIDHRHQSPAVVGVAHGPWIAA